VGEDEQEKIRMVLLPGSARYRGSWLLRHPLRQGEEEAATEAEVGEEEQEKIRMVLLPGSARYLCSWLLRHEAAIAFAMVAEVVEAEVVAEAAEAEVVVKAQMALLPGSARHIPPLVFGARPRVGAAANRRL
jgi:hypothetical protein